MRLIRLFAYGCGIYLFYLLAFPGWKGSSYHLTTLALIFAAAFALHAALGLLRIGSLIGTFLFEFSFALGLLLYMGWTMPQNSGKPPLQQWIEGRTPTQAHARNGIARIGLDPDSKPARFLIRLFPRR